MADTFTPALNLTKPEVGASRDSWGSKTNLNWDTLDQFVSQAMPIGAILDFAGPNAPSGWLICDGRWLSRTTYSDLFAVIGTTWGAGDGSTTFGLPYTNGRALVGPGSMTDQAGYSYSFPFGNAQGYVLNFITQATLPAYNLVTDYQGTHSHAGATTVAGPWNSVSDAQGYHDHGGGTTNNNLDHYHTAVTDVQGYHQHSYTTIAMTGNFVQGGSATQVSPAGALTSVDGGHQHNVTTSGASTAHSHGIYADGSHQHNSTVPAHQHGIYADGGHQHNVNLGGGGQPFDVLSPILVVTKIIYCGRQASTTALLDAVSPSAASLDTADELTLIREELAQLRAILAPPGRRVMSSPMRGTH